jgi:protein O-mannosyl-transferase
VKRTRNLIYYIASAVALATLLVYLSTLQNAFVEWDDPSYIVKNPNIRSLNLALLKWAFFGFHVSNWHPLAWLSHAIDYWAWGLNPVGHHLTSIVIHAINTFVVVLLVFKLLDVVPKPIHRNNEARSLSDRRIFITAVTTGLLFGLHPLHVESVAWISERKDLLCALFFLLSILKYIQYAKRLLNESVLGKNISQQVFNKNYVLTFIFFSLSLLSKPMAITLPIVLLLLDWYPLDRIRFQSYKALLIEKVPFFILSLFSAVLTILAQKSGGAIATIEEFPLSVRVIVGVKTLIVYLWKMIYPLNLIPFYPYPQDASLFSLKYISAIVLVIVISSICLIDWKRKIWLSVWAYYVVTLLPVLGIVQVGSQSMADRYTYLPSLSIFIAIGIGVAWVAEKLLKGRGLSSVILAGSALLTLSLIMSYLTIKQISIWKNSYSLWSYVIKKEPGQVPQAYFSLGTVFLEKEELDSALAYYSKALELNPKYVEAYENRGYIYEKMGRFYEAASDYSKSIDLRPSRYQAYYNRAGVFSKMGSPESALADYDKVIDLDPTNYNTFNNRGIIMYSTGRMDMALSAYNQAIALDPERYEAFYNRGTLYENVGQLENALADYDRTVSLNSSYDSLLLKEGVLCNRAGLYDKALKYFNEYIKKNPNNAEAYHHRGLTFVLMGQNDSALIDFTMDIELDRASPIAYFNRGSVYQKMGQKKLARSDYLKACSLGYKDGCKELRK